MDIIILILMALGFITNPDQYTEAYKQSHGTEITQATSIYSIHAYEQFEGGVVIDPDVNP